MDADFCMNTTNYGKLGGVVLRPVPISVGVRSEGAKPLASTAFPRTMDRNSSRFRAVARACAMTK